MEGRERRKGVQSKRGKEVLALEEAEKEVNYVRVGVDAGERVENGEGRGKYKGKKVGRRSTHGRGKGLASPERSYGRQTGLEAGYRQVNRYGERRVTKGRRREKGVSFASDESFAEALGVSEKGAGESVRGEGSTKRGGGVLRGWGTRRVANRYDYYREGHRVNRMSKARCKSSREYGEMERLES